MRGPVPAAPEVTSRPPVPSRGGVCAAAGGCRFEEPTVGGAGSCETVAPPLSHPTAHSSGWSVAGREHGEEMWVVYCWKKRSKRSVIILAG